MFLGTQDMLLLGKQDMLLLGTQDMLLLGTQDMLLLGTKDMVLVDLELAILSIGIQHTFRPPQHQWSQLALALAIANLGYQSKANP